MANKKVAPLTDTEIKNAKPKEKDYTLPDGNGLQLVVKTDGRKIWEIRYTIDVKAKKTTAGSYPTVTLAKARAKRDEYKNNAYEGVDPVVERKKAKEIVAAKEVANQVMLEGQFHLVAYGWLKSLANAENTHQKRVSSFENDIFPYFCTYDKHHHIISSKNIKDITHPELLKVLLKKQDTAPVVAKSTFH